MAGPGTTAPRLLTAAHGGRPCVRSRASWRRIDYLRQAVAAKLEMDWSPEQIAGWLKRIHPGNEACQVSHETIYRSLYVQARGVLKRDCQELCA